jgi:FkbH-like protein
MMTPQLYWLPEAKEWTAEVKSLELAAADPWRSLVRLANTRLDFVRTGRLDRIAQRLLGTDPPAGAHGSIRLAVLASATADHLLGGLRIGALRRGIWLQTYACSYGQYRQELFDRDSPLHRFGPEAVLFAMDARHLADRITPTADATTVAAQLNSILDDFCTLWRRARAAFKCQVLQQTVLPVLPGMLGNNEHRLPVSPQRIVRQLNELLRTRADSEGVDLVAVDSQVENDGIGAWHDPMLWHRAKQEVHPAAAPLYGDLVARIIAAQRGRSFKCLALDLDNTLWGGVIGDDGIEGIVLGQGSALGEAYSAFQRYAKALAQRGVILAVCSKNNEATALEPFDKHPEMVLRRSDIACFVANWRDKPENLRQIAATLNIGIDAIAFADDNPFERNIVRRELPEVGVPELPSDPGLYPYCISAAGYFESLLLTDEDIQRTDQYRQIVSRAALLSSSTDMAGYLRSLAMRMVWRRFDRPGLQRIHQLINKTNQFNLTTRRYTEAQVASLLDDPSTITLQIRLVDQFGDNGMIAIVIGRRSDAEPESVLVDTWLMSCRVLGRQVEEATLNLLASEAQAAGMRRIVGEYRPTAKNAMVRDHYAKLGFQAVDSTDEAAAPSQWALSLEEFRPFDTFIAVTQAEGMTV